MSLTKYHKVIFQTKKFKNDQHPLHVFSDNVKWMTQFGKSESPLIAALCHDNDQLKHESRLLVTLHLDLCPENCDTNCDQSTLTICTSQYFHSHYGIEEGLCDFYITPIKPFALKEIVLGTTDTNTFQWTKEKNFESGLIVSGTCLKNLLVRENDEFLAPLHSMFGENKHETLTHFRNLTTLDCTPVQQGLLTVNTTITVIQINKVMVEDEPPTELDRQFQFKVAMLKREHLDLLADDFDEITQVVLNLRAAQRITFDETENYQIVFLRNDEEKTKVKQTENEYFSIDIFDEKSNNPARAVVIQVVDNDLFGVDKVYISNLLWFNSMGMVDFTPCQLLPTLEVPPLASDIHLSLVLRPNYSPDIEYDKCLLKYLKRSTVLCKGDVFALKVEGDPDFYQCSSPKDMCSTKLIYYKVLGFGEKEEKNNIECCIIDLKTTNLYQEGTINSYIPFISLKSEIYGTTICGLQQFVQEFESVLLPYIDKQFNTHIPTVLLTGAAACGKKSVLETFCRRMNLNIIHINCYELLSDSSGAMEGKITAAFQKAFLYLPCVIVLNNFECVGWDKEGDKTDHRVCSSFIATVDKLTLKENMVAMIVGVTTDKHKVVPDLQPFFIHHVKISQLIQKEKESVLSYCAKHVNCQRINFQEIAKLAAGFTYGDLWEVMKKALMAAKDRVSDECFVGSKLSWQDQKVLSASGICVCEEDVKTALQIMQKQQAQIAGMPKIPTVKWSDIGGLEDAKKHIQDTIQLPLDHPELAATGLCRSGVLLYGPPGTGKTMLAKAVATQCSLNFISVKGPELINMYVGQSEENVRKVFARARESAPCVIFFDELDSLAPNRGKSGDSGGVMDRVVSQLLAELDGMQGESDEHKHVFAIGASNRPDLVDPALLRPGRFDKMIYVGVNKDKLDNLKVLQAQTRKVNLADDVDLEEIVRLCPDNMTGADFYALTSFSVMNAIREKISFIEQSGGSKDVKLEVKQKHLIRATESITPSLSAQELARYESIETDIGR